MGTPQIRDEPLSNFCFFLLEPRLYVGNTADYKPVLFSISSIKPREPESSILIMCLIRIFMLLSEALTLTKDFDQEKLQRQSLGPNTAT